MLSFSGGFKLDISDTGLKLADEVSWKLYSDVGSSKIVNYRNDGGLRVSATCGGWCGHCRPVPSLKLKLETCLLKKGIMTTIIFNLNNCIIVTVII